MNHPGLLSPANAVADLLLERKRMNSHPGARSDGRHVALVIEGGAMRGVVSAGMVGALEQLGLLNSFDSVYGSSAGAISGAYFIAGQARFGTTIFYEDINNSSFINLFRILRARPAVSLEFLLYEICKNRKPLNCEAVLRSEIDLNVVAASVTKKRSVVISNFCGPEHLIEALKASSRIPFFAGPPVEFSADRLLDASVYDSIPLGPAMARGHATDYVILLTRPQDSLRRKPDWLDRLILRPYMRRFGAEFAEHYLARAETYHREIETIRELANSTEEPNCLPIQIPKGGISVGSLEKERRRLVSGAIAGHQAVYAALGLKAPRLMEIVMPFLQDGVSLMPEVPAAEPVLRQPA